MVIDPRNQTRTDLATPGSELWTSQHWRAVDRTVDDRVALAVPSVPQADWSSLEWNIGQPGVPIEADQIVLTLVVHRPFRITGWDIVVTPRTPGGQLSLDLWRSQQSFHPFVQSLLDPNSIAAGFVDPTTNVPVIDPNTGQQTSTSVQTPLTDPTLALALNGFWGSSDPMQTGYDDLSTWGMTTLQTRDALHVYVVTADGLVEQVTFALRIRKL